ncbi:ATP-binding protein [Acetobacteraceae bacterium ESL0709]|nr:ATP-binding protein [Acetobacteraceae bacterium ESL0697]MDF7677304.1 ATP-binding protein [Acetobacteraceae bacterium ESL0709]
MKHNDVQILWSLLLRYLKNLEKKTFLRYWTSPFLGKLLLINILPLLFLAGLLLYLNQYQNGLLHTDVMALREEAHIYTRILEISFEDTAPHLTKSLDGPRAQEILDRLMQSSRDGHIRLFDPNGELLADSRRAHTVIDKHLPIDDEEYSHSDEGVWHPPSRNFIDRFYNWILLDSLAPRKKGLIPFKVVPDNDGPEDDTDLNIRPLHSEVPPYIRRNGVDALLITIIEPVKSGDATIAELQLTRRAPEIDRVLFAVRSSILTLMLVAIGVTIMLSWYFSYTIAGPILQLANAAQGLRLAGRRHFDAVPPLLLTRKDEIGSLARSIRSSAIALWARIDGTERFASEVAHEVKNPLASLSSALEILPRIEEPEARARLIKILQDDVRRLERLVRDIADASRVEGDLSRGAREPVAIEPLLALLAEIHQTTRKKNDPVMVLDVPKDTFWVCAVEDRLVQVLRNLIGNALSFSPPGGVVAIYVRKANALQGIEPEQKICQCGYIEIIIEDEGPGIPPDKLDTIFERFYSERPESEAFGQHSGLGLAISRQIIHALNGEIYAENRMGIRKDTGKEGVLGARFIICLPSCSHKIKNPDYCSG